MITPPLGKITDAINVANLMLQIDELKQDYETVFRLWEAAEGEMEHALKMNQLLFNMLIENEPSRWWRYSLCVAAGAVLVPVAALVWDVLR